jgi:hypothetical protein
VDTASNPRKAGTAAGWLARAVESARRVGWAAEFLLAAGLLLAGWPGPSGLAIAAAPNDLCTGADDIPPGGPFPYLTPVWDITGATTNGEPVIPSCQSSVKNSLWFRFAPAQSGLYTISSCSDAPTATTVEDTVMAIYTSPGACGGPFTEVPQLCAAGCADDTCGSSGLQAALTALLQADATYYIVVWRYYDEAPPQTNFTSLQLRVSKLASLPNDTCQTAVPLALNLPAAGTTFGARDDYQVGLGGCFTNSFDRDSLAEGPDVAFSFLAPRAGFYSFKVFNYSNIGFNDLVVYLLGSCPSGQSPVAVTNCVGAANRNPASTAEEIDCVALSSNQLVYLIVDDDGCIPGSSFTVEVTRCAAETETNDTPATASAFACGITGSIETSYDVDVYSMSAPAAGSRLFAMVDGEAGSRTDFDLRVTTTTNTLEYDDDNNDTLFGAKSPNVAGTPLTGELTFLQVSYKDGTPAGPYRLVASVRPPLSSAQPEIEPNDSVAQAIDAGNTSDQGYFRGALATNAMPADVDVYYFSADAGDLVLISLDCDPLRDNTPFAGKLELLDASGSVIIAVDDIASTSSTNTTPGSLESDSPYSPGEGLLYRAPEDGTFFVRVSAGQLAAGASNVGDYLLSISRNCPVCCVQGPSIEIVPAGAPDQWKLRVHGVPGAVYVVEETVTFTSWQNAGSGTAGAEGIVEFPIAVSPIFSKFYRVVLEN